MRAFIIIFAYYLVVVARARPAYVQAVARVAQSTNIGEIALRMAGPWAVRFVQAAARAFGPPPARIVQAARAAQEQGDTTERRPVYVPAGERPGSGSTSSGDAGGGGGVVGQLIPGLAGLAGAVLGGPAAGAAASAAAGALQERGEQKRREESVNIGECHLEFGPGRFDASQIQKYGDPSRVGHLRVGKCREAQGARQSCIGLEPNAIRLGDDYVAARYAGRLAAGLADKFRRADGTLTTAGKRVLAAAYVNTLRAVQTVPKNTKKFLEKFGYFSPDGACATVPPHRYQITDLLDDPQWGFVRHLATTGMLSDAPTAQVGWLTLRNNLLMQSVEFLNQITRELHSARPLPGDVKRAVARNQYTLAGSWGVNRNAGDPPRIVLNQTNADDFLPATD